MTELALPESIAIPRPDPSLIRSSTEFLATAKLSYAEIGTPEQCEAAGEDLKLIKARQKQLEEARTKITKPLLEAQRALNALFKAPMETLAEAERLIKQALIAYQEAEERKRQLLEAEAAMELRRQRERLETQAAEAQAKGEPEKARALQSAAAAMPERMQLAPTAPKVSGVAARATWRAEVIDKLAFVRYVAEHAEWLNLVEPNLQALNGLARSQKSALAIPGVKALEERFLAARAL